MDLVAILLEISKYYLMSYRQYKDIIRTLVLGYSHSMKFALGMAVIKNFDDNKTLILAFAIPGYSQSEMLINLLMQSKFTTS